jgi:DNA-binding NarL/FixJ family response regulator
MGIKILLADDHKMIRTSLGRLLAEEMNLEIIGEADNGRETVKLAKDLTPDIIIMDIGMPELNGIEATKQIVQISKKIKVIALSMHSDKMFVTGMFKAGASGYLLKDSAFDELIDAIKTVVDNKIYLSKEITGIVVSELIEALSKDYIGEPSSLSDREKEVLQLLVEGKSTKEIANVLNLSIKTIESHRKNIMTKLEIYTIPELTKYAVRMGITSLH